ncbi:MAG: hypothetical protein AAB445_01435 [Patescibacteria group bacterium]
MSDITKQIIKNDTILRRLQYFLIIVIIFGVIIKVINLITVSSSLRSAIFMLFFGILVSFLSIIVLIGLLKYKKWPYWVLIIISISGSTIDRAIAGDWITTIQVILLQIILPIYMLMRISKLQKEIMKNTQAQPVDINSSPTI